MQYLSLETPTPLKRENLLLLSDFLEIQELVPNFHMSSTLQTRKSALATLIIPSSLFNIRFSIYLRVLLSFYWSYTITTTSWPLTKRFRANTFNLTVFVQVFAGIKWSNQREFAVIYLSTTSVICKEIRFLFTCQSLFFK